MIFLFVLSCHSPKMKDTVPPFQDVLLSDDVILSEVQTCTNPSPNIHYQMYELPIVENSNINIHEHLDGGMIFVADFNQDGLLDIGNCFDLDSLYLYFGEEYSHDGISFSSYVHLSEDCSPSVVIDIDEDGDLDILRLSDKLQLFRNRLGESLATTDQMLFSKENLSLPLSRSYHTHCNYYNCAPAYCRTVRKLEIEKISKNCREWEAKIVKRHNQACITRP